MGRTQSLFFVVIAWASLQVDSSFLQKPKAKTLPKEDQEQVETIVQKVEHAVQHFLHLDRKNQKQAAPAANKKEPPKSLKKKFSEKALESGNKTFHAKAAHKPQKAMHKVDLKATHKLHDKNLAHKSVGSKLASKVAAGSVEKTISEDDVEPFHWKAAPKDHENESAKTTHRTPKSYEIDQIEPQDRLLLLVPVGSKPESLDTLRDNVNHLRTQFVGHVDVFVMHYKEPDESWMARHSVWWAKNIQNSTHRSGIKFPLASKVITEFEQIKYYSWIWVIDDDIDITQADMPYLFELADESRAPLVGPSIGFPPGVYSQAPLGRNEAEARLQDQAESTNGSSTYDLYRCQPDDWFCRYQAPDPTCRYSYTEFVEVMAPMFRPKALWQILHECEGCFSERSVWGLDFVWCSLTAKAYNLPRDRGCALIDQGTVIHNNVQSLPKYGHDGDQIAAEINQENTNQYLRVEERYREDFAKPWKTEDNGDSWKPICVH